ncbi:hypothetical protein Tamer19_00920 [Cupriavidus sp. TA19]|uniref:hypothetical protein n=1 Tax=unclassified Cupriavidus TaxID=2640874 RepID=UPI000E2EA27D|nr:MULTISPECIES: hypothetical protein [unclassified Cupriavidus]BDB28593.1 hypothetical protein CTP10_R60040 [Cupriavidus sp. P-10]GLC90684.1 hypothetical protein Tamer19_00920 [Cupriavidus sp. TA19]
MNDWQDRGPAGRDVDTPHRLRAVVATYRPALQAYTLAVSPAELMALGAVPANMAQGTQASDPRAQAHLARLRGEVQASGIALPGAIVLAVSGGILQCECDHLYTLQLQPCRGDRLIVMEGYERLLALAHGERRQCKTLVSAVMWRTALDNAAQMSLADAGQLTEAEDAAEAAAAATQSCAARWANATRVWH